MWTTKEAVMAERRISTGIKVGQSQISQQVKSGEAALFISEPHMMRTVNQNRF